MSIATTWLMGALQSGSSDLLTEVGFILALCGLAISIGADDFPTSSFSWILVSALSDIASIIADVASFFAAGAFKLVNMIVNAVTLGLDGCSLAIDLHLL